MKTISFIGSEKNAGKTTTMNFVIKGLQNKFTFCLTSIGVNGEKEDLWYGTPKPTITIPKNHLFLTHERHLKTQLGKFTIINRFFPHDMGDFYLLAKANEPLIILLEGPNDKNGLLRLKKYLNQNLPETDFLFIDGSIDRQVIGHPDVSDSFFISLSVKDKASLERKKMETFILPFSFPEVNEQTKAIIKHLKSGKDSFKYILFEGRKKKQTPFYGMERLNLSSDIFSSIDGFKSPSIYCNFALTNLTLQKIPPNVNIILDNFTLFQADKLTTKDQKRIFLLQKPDILKLFLREESFEKVELPGLTHYSICNLYREDLFDEISIPL